MAPGHRLTPGLVCRGGGWLLLLILAGLATITLARPLRKDERVLACMLAVPLGFTVTRSKWFSIERCDGLMEPR